FPLRRGGVLLRAGARGADLQRLSAGLEPARAGGAPGHLLRRLAGDERRAPGVDFAHLVPPMMRRLLREPALHFAVAGAALFALYALVRKPAASRIVVDRAVVLGLREEHARLLGTAPSPAQERELVERWIDEEVLAREAVALGLDRGDPI